MILAVESMLLFRMVISLFESKLRLPYGFRATVPIGTVALNDEREECVVRFVST